MVSQELINYEESVNWMRDHPEHTELVKLCYLDRDNLEAAKRFAVSEEFQEISKLLQLNDRNSPPQVLDLGCGNGIASYAFASLGCQVTAVDPNTSDDVGLMATARLRSYISNGSLSTIQATAESLPFSDNTFDVIYERQALHHFSDLFQGLTECARVLKPGGLFLATREHIVNDAQQLEQFFAGHILHQKHGSEYAYPVAYYIRSLKRAGFTVVQKIASMDNVINHFPASNADVYEAMCTWYRSKFGNAIASSIIQLPFVEKAYRQFRSMRDQAPGRLYSFLSTK
jgi:ubiquinone/menaquinone biosynthesis C-methylase UbiE